MTARDTGHGAKARAYVNDPNIHSVGGNVLGKPRRWHEEAQ